MPSRPTQTKIKRQLEITYEYHPTERCLQEHYMYCEVAGTDFEDCCEKAKKYYEKQMASLGWTKFTTLKEIGPLTHATKSPISRKHNPGIDEAPDAKPAPDQPGTKRKDPNKRSKPKRSRKTK